MGYSGCGRGRCRICSKSEEAAYRRDERTKAAVERKLEVIGEALNQLARIDPDLAEKISAKRQIIGMRNVLIHGYMAVNDGLVWRTICTDLSVLRAEVAGLLAQADKDGQ